MLFIVFALLLWLSGCSVVEDIEDSISIEGKWVGTVMIATLSEKNPYHNYDLSVEFTLSHGNNIGLLSGVVTHPLWGEGDITSGTFDGKNIEFTVSYDTTILLPEILTDEVTGVYSNGEIVGTWDKRFDEPFMLYKVE